MATKYYMATVIFRAKQRMKPHIYVSEIIFHLFWRTRLFVMRMHNFYLSYKKENSAKAEKSRKTLEQHCKDLQMRLDGAESSSMKGGKKIIQKLEQKVC